MGHIHTKKKAIRKRSVKEEKQQTRKVTNTKRGRKRGREDFFDVDSVKIEEKRCVCVFVRVSPHAACCYFHILLYSNIPPRQDIRSGVIVLGGSIHHV